MYISSNRIPSTCMKQPEFYHIHEMVSTSETGLQLFARLIPRPSLIGLNETLFPDGPNPKEVVEINGESSCGKTLLFTQFIAKCILPKEWKTTNIGGLKAGVVLLNTDYHFQIFKLISLMENQIRSIDNSFATSDIEEIVKDSLPRLLIYNIADSNQLQVTLYALRNVVANQPDIGLVLLDSVCAFYWQDTMASGIRKMDLYAKNVLKNLQKALVDFKGVIMYTRPVYFQSKTSKAEMCCVEPGLGSVNRRILLKQTTRGSENIFCASVETSLSKFDEMFTINSGGIKWSE